MEPAFTDATRGPGGRCLQISQTFCGRASFASFRPRVSEAFGTSVLWDLVQSFIEPPGAPSVVPGREALGLVVGEEPVPADRPHAPIGILAIEPGLACPWRGGGEGLPLHGGVPGPPVLPTLAPRAGPTRGRCPSHWPGMFAPARLDFL